MALVAQRATQSVVFIFVCKDREGWEDEHKGDKDKGQPTACPNAAPQPSGTSEASQTELFYAGSGSGFFIGPKTIVTNMHVIRDAKAVFVTNRFLGRVQPGTVKAATVKKIVADPDFAVVEIDTDQSPPPVPLTANVTRLQNVVSAGYPGIIIEEDEQRERLLRGDPAAAPELTTFPGFVTLTMNEDKPLPLIFSSAVIGHGNSGGPLLDLCASAVGMNTLGWSGEAEDTGYKVNIAEGSKGLMTFLDNNQIGYQKSEESCGAAQQPEKPPTTGPIAPAPQPPASGPGSPAPPQAPDSPAGPPQTAPR
jgi:S1-C subfamily serine protease